VNAIIFYYSNSGKTERLAFKVQNDLKCKISKIEPKLQYGNYIKSVIRFMKNRKNKSAEEFVNEIPNLLPYDTVLIGYPIWGGDMPPFVAAFINQCKLEGKIVIPFATFGGTDISGSIKTLQQVCKEAEIKFPFNYGMSKKDNYENWMQQIMKC